MARKPLTRRMLAGVLLVMLLGMGCNPLLMPFQLFHLNDSRLPSEFDFYEKAKKAKNKKELRVVLLAYRGSGLSQEYIGTERDLANMFVNCVKAGFENNKEKVTIVSLNEVEKFKQRHDDWKSMDASQICKHFNADYMIDMEMASLSLYEPSSIPRQYRGRVKIQIHIMDADKDASELFAPYTYEYEYPGSEQSIPADEMGQDKFRQMFFQKIATGLTRLFTGIPAEHEFR
jgi:hypothetical protein